LAVVFGQIFLSLPTVVALGYVDERSVYDFHFGEGGVGSSILAYPVAVLDLKDFVLPPDALMP